MPFNRDEALRAAEKALKTGRLDQAIAEYARIVEYQPRDFNSANTLGDLYARAGQTEAAVAQYTRIAEQFLADGFYPKASALFKKILKIRPDEETALLRLGQLAAKQGLFADARSFLNDIANRRRARGDEWGADDILIELADTEAADSENRMQAARILAARGQGDAAAERLRNLAVDLLEKERTQEAVDVLRETVHLVPDDRIARKQLIGLLTDLDQAGEAEVYLTRDVAAGDPAMLLVLAKAELEAGRLEEGREDIRAALAQGSSVAAAMAFMRDIAPRNPEAGYIAAEALADAALARREVEPAVEALRGFLALAPSYVAGGLRFVEVCLEEGLDDLLMAAQAALADAYIAAGQPEAGRVIAEDLAAAAPEDAEARERLRRARQACGLPPEESKGQRAEGTGDDQGEGEREREEEPIVLDPFESEPIMPEPFPTEPVQLEPIEPVHLEPLLAAPPPAASEPRVPDLVDDVPEFDIYVYGQPIAEPEPEPAPEPRTEPMEPAERVEPEEPDASGESEEEFIARLLAAEAEQQEPMVRPEVAPEIDLTATLDALDDPSAPDAPPFEEETVPETRDRKRAEEDQQAEAAFEEAAMAAALGQIDDAERLYAEASRSALFRFRAAAALGRVLAGEGRLAEAIEWFERATEVPAPDRDAGYALLYELGEALERHGETMRALAIFMELNADAGDYRGVAARVERLARAEIGG